MCTSSHQWFLLIQIYKLWRSQISNLWSFLIHWHVATLDQWFWSLQIFPDLMTMNYFRIYPKFTDLCHVSSRSDDLNSLQDFTRSSQIYATCLLDPMVQIHFESLVFDNIISQIETPLQFTRSSWSIDKCPRTDRQLLALQLFELRVFQTFTFFLPLDLMRNQHVPLWI